MRRLAGEYNGLCYKNKTSTYTTLSATFDITNTTNLDASVDINNSTSLNKILKVLLLLDLI